MSNLIAAIELLLDGLDDEGLESLTRKIKRIVEERKRGIQLDEVTKIWVVSPRLDDRRVRDITTTRLFDREELDVELYRYFWVRGFD